MKKKSTIFKVLLTIIIIVVILAIIAGVYLFSKIHSLSDSITNPLDRDKSELRDKPAKEGDPMTVVLYGIDDDAQREQQGMGQRSDSIVLMSINPKDKNCNGKCTRDTRAKIVGKGTTEKLTMHMHTAVLKWQSTHWKN